MKSFFTDFEPVKTLKPKSAAEVQEIINMINRSLKRGAGTILTTEKDAVRFPKIDRRDIPIYYLRVEIRIISGAKDFDDAVAKICHR